MIKYFVGGMLILALTLSAVVIFYLKINMSTDNYFGGEQKARFESLSAWLGILFFWILFFLNAVGFVILFGYVPIVENVPFADGLLFMIFILVFISSLVFILLFAPLIKERFTFAQPIIDYILAYRNIEKKGTKINFKTFKDVFAICPQNFEFSTYSYWFSYNKKREGFYFNNFLSFLRADVFVGKYMTDQEKKKEDKKQKVSDSAALQLMQQAVEDKLNESLNNIKVAAQESKNIMKRMSK